MTIHRPILVTGQIYHLYDKSIADTIIFNGLSNLKRAISLVDYYRFNQRIRLSKFYSLSESAKKYYLKEIHSTTPLVDFYALSFMPNHYHFLLKQLQDNGIKKFISNFQNSYSKSFNLIREREGSLFIHNFKTKLITSEETFIHVCRYIHINHVTSRLIEFDQLKTYPFSSYSWYLNKNLNKFINTDSVMNHFKNKNKFIKFHENQIDYQRRLKEIKKILLE